jgi:bifunctional non-homologous end joining protein LigD
MARRSGDSVRLVTRNGFDWTDRFPLVAAATRAPDISSCLIDGKAIASGDADGLADFQLLRRRVPAILCAFDLVELDGKDMRREPIEVRKAELARLLHRSTIGLELNEHIDDEDAARVIERACRLGFEGIVPKRKGSRYQSGRSYDWLKSQPPTARQRKIGRPRGCCSDSSAKSTRRRALGVQGLGQSARPDCGHARDC